MLQCFQFPASVIVVIVPAGAIIGGFLMDSIGRLNTIKLSAIPGAIGWVLIAMATNVPMIIIGRLLTGLASAWGTSPAIVYITEIAKADMRGSLISSAPAYASLGKKKTNDCVVHFQTDFLVSKVWLSRI